MKLHVEGRTFHLDNTSPEAIQEAASILAQDTSILFGLVNAHIEPPDHPDADSLRQALYAHLYGLGNCSDDALIGIRNFIANGPILLRAPSIHEMPVIDAPAIAIGAAPSLVRHLDRLRELQKSCLLVCSDTILGPLMDQGIFPHLVTPLERTTDMPARLPQDPGETTYAGTVVFDRRGVERFKHHLLIPPLSSFADWVGCEGIAYGSSTGTMSVAVALRLTTGPVYLVGHDLSFPADGDSHWAPATAIRANAEHKRDNAWTVGHHGEKLASTNLFKFYQTDMALMAMKYGRIHNVNAFDGIGAAIAGCLSSDLPAPGPALAWMPPGTTDESRMARFAKVYAETSEGIETALRRIEFATSIDTLNADSVSIGSFRPLLEVMLRPVWVQFSFEKHLGCPEPVLLAGLKDAMSRVLRDLHSTLKGGLRHEYAA